MPRPEPPIKTDMSLETFLSFELGSKEKHELVGGQVFLMAGGTRRHNRIAVRLGSLIEHNSQHSRCLVAIADTFVLANNALYYPDVMVYCEPEDDPRIVKNPCLIVEVLSDRTAETDRGEKWLNYQTLRSLQMYVLLEQDTMRAEVFKRTFPDRGRGVEGSWLYEKVESGVLRLSCVDLEIALTDIYSRLE
jgi:Uma2 family endonuclease